MFWPALISPVPLTSHIVPINTATGSNGHIPRLNAKRAGARITDG